MKVSLDRIREKSIVCKAGAELVPAVKHVVIDYSSEFSDKVLLPKRKVLSDTSLSLDSVETEIASWIDEECVNRLSPFNNISVIKPCDSAKNGFYTVDAYRMVAAVEEANANFEAWVVPSGFKNVLNSILLGFPVFYLDCLHESMYGGMWSDTIIGLDENLENNNYIGSGCSSFFMDIIVRHYAAFVKMVPVSFVNPHVNKEVVVSKRNELNPFYNGKKSLTEI